jgi:hypothetical protein
LCSCTFPSCPWIKKRYLSLKSGVMTSCSFDIKGFVPRTVLHNWLRLTSYLSFGLYCPDLKDSRGRQTETRIPHISISLTNLDQRHHNCSQASRKRLIISGNWKDSGSGLDMYQGLHVRLPCRNTWHRDNRQNKSARLIRNLGSIYSYFAAENTLLT